MTRSRSFGRAETVDETVRIAVIRSLLPRNLPRHGQSVAPVDKSGLQKVIHGHLVAATAVIRSRRATDFRGPFTVIRSPKPIYTYKSLPIVVG